MPAQSVDLQRYQLGSKLIELGVRPHLVAHMLGMPQPTVIKWYEEINGHRTKRGPLKAGASSYVTSKKTARQLTVFCSIYSKLSGLDRKEKSLNSITNLIRSIEAYNRLNPDEAIDGTMAWMAARDLNSGLLKFKFCPKCRTRFIYLLESPFLRKCCFCTTRKGRPMKKAAPHTIELKQSSAAAI